MKLRLKGNREAVPQIKPCRLHLRQLPPWIKSFPPPVFPGTAAAWTPRRQGAAVSVNASCCLSRSRDSQSKQHEFEEDAILGEMKSATPRKGCVVLLGWAAASWGGSEAPSLPLAVLRISTGTRQIHVKFPPRQVGLRSTSRSLNRKLTTQ